MLAREQQIKNIEGMQRDWIQSSGPLKYAYTLKNVRITNRENQSLLAIENERGTNKVTLTGSVVKGQVIGVCSISDYLVLFSIEGNINRIYRIDSNYNCVLKFEGELNFSKQHPIDTLGYYESENVIKVYWIDGINPLRCINIMKNMYLGKASEVDSYPEISTRAKISVLKQTSGGMFTPGNIKYYATFSTKHGAESGIFWITPFYYITDYNGFGVSSEGYSTCSFKILIRYVYNEVKQYDYINIYSAHYPSLDGIPVTKLVKSFKIVNYDGEYETFIDTGTVGSLVSDTTALSKKNGESIAYNSIETKENTLYLGSGSNLDQSIFDKLNDIINEDEHSIIFDYDSNKKCIEVANCKDYYDYKSTLNTNSSKITTFKEDEDYRFGIRCMLKDGSISDPIYLGDKNCDKHVKNANNGDFDDNTSILLPFAKSSISSNVSKKLKDLGVIKIIPVVVYPNISERNVICQGVLNPTMFNPRTRYNNTIFSQASYVFRPNAPYTIKEAENYTEDEYNTMTDLYKSDVERKYTHNETYRGYVNVCYYNLNISKTAQIREHTSINGNYDKESEYESIYNNKKRYVATINNYSKDYSKLDDIIQDAIKAQLKSFTFNLYYDDYTYEEIGGENIDFLKGQLGGVCNINIDYNSYKSEGGSPIEFRNFYCTHNPMNVQKDYSNFFKKDFNKLLLYGWLYSTEIQNNNYFIDSDYEEALDKQLMNTAVDNTGYWGYEDAIDYTQHYMFVDQSIVTLNSPDIEFNTELEGFNFNGCKMRIVGAIPITANYFQSDIQTKRTDGASTSLETQSFFINTKNFNNEAWKTTVSYPSIKDTYSDWDKYLITHMFHNTVNPINNDVWVSIKTKIFANFKFSNKTYFPDTKYNWSCSNDSVVMELYNSDAPITKTLTLNNKWYDTINYNGTINNVSYNRGPYYLLSGGKYGYDPEKFGGGKSGQHTDKIHEAIEMKYKSTPHIVMALDYKNGKQNILPTYENVNHLSNQKGNMYCMPGLERKYITIQQDAFPTDSFINKHYGWLWLGEIYRTIPLSSKFGGDPNVDPECIKNCIWYNAGDFINLDDFDEGDNVIINWTEGDYFYQRYDCLKTYPYSYEDQNQVVDILSFYCYTRINLDGRYDNHRGITNLLYNNPTNFNVLNDAYSTTKDVLQASAVSYTDEDMSSSNESNILRWSNTKTNFEEIDTWMNTNEYNRYNLDGSLGKLVGLSKFKDKILVFQEHAVSYLLSNEQELTTKEGVDVSIVSSGKVKGHKIITDIIGCQNKWSICKTPKRVYWVDNNLRDIYSIPSIDGREDYSNISNEKLMSSFMYSNSGKGEWNLDNCDNYITLYDAINEDVFFIKKNSEICLAFNERMETFTSFYDYYKTDLFSNYNNEGIFIKGNSLYLEHKGDYNMFFDDTTTSNFIIELQSHGDDGHLDKTFNTVEFRGDTFDSSNKKLDNVDIIKIKAKTEYQESENDLDIWSQENRHNTLNKQSLYRMWRVEIPRDTSEEVSTVGRYKYNRIRNPWIMLKLTGGNTKFRTLIHDFIIHYTE